MKIMCTLPTNPQDLTDKLGKEYQGVGVPNAQVGDISDLYLRTDGGATTTLYVKTAATTWTAK